MSHRIERAADRHIHIALNELKGSQTDRGWHQIPSCTTANELLLAASIQAVPRAHARHYEEDRHEPRVNDIHVEIDILRIGICDPADHAEDSLRIVHIDHVINNDKHDRDPSYII